MGRARAGHAKKRRSDEAATEAAPTRGQWSDASELHNDLLVKYYRGGAVPEEEWAACYESFKQALPTSFRCNTSLAGCEELRAFVLGRLSGPLELTPIAFVPRGMAFQTTLSRTELKRHADNALAKRIVNSLSDEGLLSRQEAVSMIPPLLLDPQPGHRVLDMCAAPGSKTTQILETLVRGGPGGCVVANDINPGRLDVLSHQVGRLPNTKSRLLVTHHDATAYPQVIEAADKFDRVLCDVMCSGDGTLRKSRDLWGRWTPMQGPALHKQQAQVLQRGMRLVKAGGVVVYSTCSLNPVEDEAVISKCLAESDGCFELVDTADLLPDLKRYAGLSQWRLLSRDGETEFPVPEGARDHRVPLVPSMWSPGPDVAAAQGLRHCIRVAPHLQDTGGFFIAALRCVREPEKSVSSTVVRKHVPALQPVTPELVATLQRVLDLPESFPWGNLFSLPEATRLPKVYYLNDDAAALMGRINAKVTLAGVKVFDSSVKQSFEHMRFTSDGVATLVDLLPPTHVLDVAPAALLRLNDAALRTAKAQSIEVATDALRTALTEAAAQRVQEHGWPKRHCIVRAALQNGLGALACSGEVHGATVTVRLEPTQVDLLRLGLGLDPVLPEPEAKDEAKPDDGAAAEEAS